MAKAREQKTMIVLDKLVPRKDNRLIGSRKENLDGLVASIKEKGVITALIVRTATDAGPVPDGAYEVVCGHRRRLAAKAAGLSEVPCEVRELSDLEAGEIAAIDNLQREDLHPLDEAALYESLAKQAREVLIDNPEAAIEQVAARVGKPLAYVRARMKLLALSPKARLTWLEGKGDKISLGHALVLCRYPAAVQDQLVSWISKEWQPPSVSELQRHIASRIYVELAKAPFRMDDAQLLPQAGACLTCPKRTGADHLLFPEVGKKDLCLDPKCYQAKVDVDSKKRISELKASGEPFYLVSGSYDYGEKFPEGTLRHGAWQRAGKGEAKDAVRCLIVHGEGKGSIVMGFKARDGGMHGERQVMSPKEKEKRRAQISENRIQREIVSSLLEKTIAGLHEIFGKGPSVPEGFTRALAFRVFEHISMHEETKLCKSLGWERSKERTGGRYSYTYDSWKPTAKRELEKMTLPEVHLFIARYLLAESLPPDPQDTDLLRELAALAKLDPKKIEAEIRDAAKAKKDSKPLKLSNISPDGIKAQKAREKKRKAKAASKKGRIPKKDRAIAVSAD